MIHDLVIRRIRPDEAGVFRGFTFKTFSALLAPPAVHAPEQICLGAWVQGIPVGLALAGPALLALGRYQLYSIMVAPAWRRRGIGRELVRAVAAETGRRGVATLATEWSDRLPGAHTFAALLAGTGFGAPQATLLRVSGPVAAAERLFRPGFVDRIRADGLRLRSWQDIGPAAQALADTLERTGGIPPWANPVSQWQELAPDLSLVLTDTEGKIQGWIICTAQRALNRWVFPIGWVSPAYAKRGWLLAGVAEAARLLMERYGPDARVALETSPHTPAMWQILERQFTPVAQWSDRLLTASVTVDTMQPAAMETTAAAPGSP
ncbi:GNAT family N-acetyltransferase [Oleisolibacter albus]|uniref:GNAT family N-acetyltransferase n=1 Tax=Oleisolibacter albus TaxID=2171757 RepID=UPI001875BF22|nr:GNAT family N-acetyltransferase [Oleisolibacter albus]